MKKRILSLLLTLVCLNALSVPAFATDEFDHNHPHNTPGLENFSVYYEMDGNNVIERVLLPDIEIVRTIYPNNTMLVESIENGAIKRIIIDADYSIFKSLYAAQQLPIPYNNDLVGSQYIHQYVGSPGTVILTKDAIRDARDASWIASAILSQVSFPAAVASVVAAVIFSRNYEDADYDEVHVTSDTYQVLFAVDRSYYIHCYHQRFDYYRNGAARPFRTEMDYYQAIGG